MKRRAHATGGGALAVAAAAAWCGPGLAVHSDAVARAIGVARRLPGRAGVAITFDDGPHPEGTPAVLEALRAAGARATFFLVGEQVRRHRSLTREIAVAGHEIAVHADRHRNQMRLLPPVFAADLRRAMATITEVSGQPVRHYRPPYGAFTPAGLVTVRRAGLRPLLWSQWGRDWRAHTTAAEIARLATRKLSGGDVILLHDSDAYSSPGAHRRTVAALPAILGELERLGLAAVTAAEASVTRWPPGG